MVPGNRLPEVLVPDNSLHLVHLRLQIAQYDEQTGQPLQQPFIQCFWPDELKRMMGTQVFKGYKVDIVHAPEAWEPTIGQLPMGGKVRTATQKMMDEYAQLTGEAADEDWTTTQLQQKIKEAKKAKSA
jgi:hypothetical protein